MSLHALHRVLAANDLAMSNVGSISDQSIGGIITTASHGSGVDFPVISAGILQLTLILSDTSVVTCSRDANPDLFLATLCGLGTTGFILRVKIQVEKAFRLEETAEPMLFTDFVRDETFEEIGSSSEHTRVWWFPHADSVSVGRANRTYAVSVGLNLDNCETCRSDGLTCFHGLLSLPILLPRLALGFGASFLASTLSSSSSSSPDSSPPSLLSFAGLSGSMSMGGASTASTTATKSSTLTASYVAASSLDVSQRTDLAVTTLSVCPVYVRVGDPGRIRPGMPSRDGGLALARGR